MTLMVSLIAVAIVYVALLGFVWALLYAEGEREGKV